MQKVSACPAKIALRSKIVVNSAMKKLKFLSPILLSVFLAFSVAAQQNLPEPMFDVGKLILVPLPGKPVDTLIVGGTIVTMNAKRDVINDGAIAIWRGQIIMIGTRQEVTSKWRALQTINATGKVII